MISKRVARYRHLHLRLYNPGKDNGLDDRLQQTVNGNTTNYTLDIAAGLTQVLSDGENAYLYGAGRIGEEQPDGWQYPLGDAPGNVGS